MTHREQTLAALEALGFQTQAELPPELELASATAASSASSEPDADEQGRAALRPAREIALRAMTLEAVFSYAGAPEDAMSTQRLQAYAKRNSLEAEMSEDELEIWQLAREEAQDEHGETIDWLLEELWPLAWALGYPRAPEVVGSLIPDDVIQEIFYEFLPGLDASADALLAKSRLRSLDEIAALEDLFTCALALARGPNAKKNVPAGMKPQEAAELLRQRLRALRFCISPDADWEDIEL